MEYLSIGADVKKYDLPAVAGNEGETFPWPKPGDNLNPGDTVYIILRGDSDVGRSYLYAQGNVTTVMPLSTVLDLPQWGKEIDPDYFLSAYSDPADSANLVAEIEIDRTVDGVATFAVDKNGKIDRSSSVAFAKYVKNKKHPYPEYLSYPVSYIVTDEELDALEKLLNTTPADYAAMYRNIFGNLSGANTGVNSR